MKHVLEYKGKMSHQQHIKQENEEMVLTNVLKDVDDKEWRDQVIDALHVATGRVADGPDKQDSLKNLTKHKKCKH